MPWHLTAVEHGKNTAATVLAATASRQYIMLAPSRPLLLTVKCNVTEHPRYSTLVTLPARRHCRGLQYGVCVLIMFMAASVIVQYSNNEQLIQIQRNNSPALSSKLQQQLFLSGPNESSGASHISMQPSTPDATPPWQGNETWLLDMIIP